MSQLEAARPLLPIDEMGDVVVQGTEWSTDARSGDRLELPGLGSFVVGAGSSFGIETRHRAVEARDLPEAMRGAGVVERCRHDWFALDTARRRSRPDAEVEALRQTLRVAYLAVPTHLRVRLPAAIAAEVPPT